MAIIRPALRKQKPISAPQYDEVPPFVPAFDLYEREHNKPSSEEIAAIALTLFLATPSPQRSGPWTSHSRISSLRS